MLYINYKLVQELEEDGHNPFDLIELLTAINQSNLERVVSLKRYIDDTDLTFKGVNLIKYIKAKNKNQDPLELIRLDKAGKDLLKEITESEVTEEDEKVFTWLSDLYKKLDKEVGNGSKTKRHIRDFRTKSGIEKNNLVKLCYAFVSDETNMEYSHKLEYIFYKPKTVFATKFDLEESRLYQYYIRHKEQFDKTFTEDGA